MIREAVAVELEMGQMVIISAYGRGATAIPARASLLTVLNGPHRASVGVDKQGLIDLIAAFTQVLNNIQQMEN